MQEGPEESCGVGVSAPADEDRTVSAVNEYHRPCAIGQSCL